MNVRLLEAIPVSHAAEIMSIEGSRRHLARPQSVRSPPVIIRQLQSEGTSTETRCARLPGICNLTYKAVGFVFPRPPVGRLEAETLPISYR